MVKSHFCSNLHQISLEEASLQVIEGSFISPKCSSSIFKKFITFLSPSTITRKRRRTSAVCDRVTWEWPCCRRTHRHRTRLCSRRSRFCKGESSTLAQHTLGRLVTDKCHFMLGGRVHLPTNFPFHLDHPFFRPHFSSWSTARHTSRPRPRATSRPKP